MRYEIQGDTLPVVICYLDNGESMITEGGAMAWMSPNMRMDTNTGGGIKKMLGRMFSGESLFLNEYTAQGGSGMIAFASSFPGSIIPYRVTPGNGIIVQKRGFLAMEKGLELSMYFQKKLGKGFFGGEGFIMQKLSGHGTAFVEIDGYAVEYNLTASQSIIVDTGYLAMMDATCSLDVVAASNVKNALFGGEGLFNTVVHGPGKIVLQTMPVNKVAGAIRPYIPTGN